MPSSFSHCYPVGAPFMMRRVKQGVLKYKEVEEEMRQLARTLPVGAKLPPERHLAITYHCNFLTVRKALKSLVEDGLIVRKIGSGTFVADPSQQKKLPKPNKQPSARSREKRVGLMVFQKSNAYAHKLLQSIAHSALEEEILLRSCWVQNFREDALTQARSLVGDGCTAIVLPWFPLTMVNDVKSLVEQSPVPISIPLVIPGLEENYFGKAERFGSNLIDLTTKLCRYFSLLGRSRVAFVGPATAEDQILQRMLPAYTAYIAGTGMPNLGILLSPANSSADRCAEQLKAYRGDLGVVCYDDAHALRLMTAMHKLGLSAPGDYAIIGHNDTEASHYSDPPLSTVTQDFTVISRSLLRNALALARGSSYHAESLTPATLLVRDTCGGRGRIDESLKKEMGALILEEQTDVVPR